MPARLRKFLKIAFLALNIIVFFFPQKERDKEGTKMEVVRISKGNLEKKVEIIAQQIKKGAVLVLPTDTVYGLAAEATNEEGVKRIFRIKKRPKDKVLSIFVRDIKMAKEFAFINKEAERFLKNAWPGRLTAVLRAKPKAKRLFGFGIVSPEGKIGLRIPKYRLINRLLKELNFPLTGTSANISGRPSLSRIKDVFEQFKGKRHQPEIIVDGGNLPKRKPSAVVDLTIVPPMVLRP